MRIEINSDLVKELENIKSERGFSGKGYTQVIHFLIQVYKQNKDIRAVMNKLTKDITRSLDEQREVIEAAVEKAMRKYFKRLFLNIIGKDEEDE